LGSSGLGSRVFGLGGSGFGGRMKLMFVPKLNSQKGFVPLHLIVIIAVICVVLFAGYKLLGTTDTYDSMRQQPSELTKEDV